MKTTFILILISNALIILNLSAQDNPLNHNANCEHTINFEAKLKGRVFINKYPGKSIQFYKNWMQGELLLSDGNIVTNKVLLYNSLLDELIWRRSTDYKQVILNKQAIAGFTLYNSDNIKVAEFQKKYLKNASDSTGTFLQILTEGKISLYVKREVLFKENSGEFQGKNNYYLLKNGEFYPLIPYRWFLYRLMGEDKAKMKTIVRKNFLFIKKEPALIKAIQLFNEES